MKVSLDSPELVKAMLACFFGNGPRYEEIMQRTEVEEGFAYEDDDVNLGGDLTHGILTPGGLRDWIPEGVLAERAQEEVSDA